MHDQIKTILYASDTLLGSRPVFKYALMEAKQHQAKIVYLHVLDPNSSIQEMDNLGYLPTQVHSIHDNQTQEQEINRVIQRVEKFFIEEDPDLQLKCQPEVIIKVGRADTCIVNTAKEVKADLIVMGDRSNNNLTRFFLGSTAHNVIRNSNVPVVVVPIKNNDKYKKKGK